MAKLQRKHYAQFASFTNLPSAASAAATFEGDEITNVEITAATFGTAVDGQGGTYLFTYDGTNWKYKGATITPETYGITITGTPGSGDTITVKFSPANNGWSVLGHDSDDLSKEMNPDTETQKNVLGENSFVHNGYEPEVALDNYFADPYDPIYPQLLEIAMNEDNSESGCLGYYADAVFEEVNETTKIYTGYAWMQRAWIIPQSVGGDTSGMHLPFNVNPVGARTKYAISYDAATYTPTFTAIT